MAHALLQSLALEREVHATVLMFPGWLSLLTPDEVAESKAFLDSATELEALARDLVEFVGSGEDPVTDVDVQTLKATLTKRSGRTWTYEHLAPTTSVVRNKQLQILRSVVLRP